ncbi:hypothetical protein [Mannheimia pernigra]|uniref:hypothetical protein n=1 Tax=Mannheimia pernigra TaxID=111844 RepID=UPI003EBF0BD5
MDAFYKNLCTIVVLSVASTFSVANQPQNLPQLNQFDAAEKLRQQQHHQAQQKQIQYPVDVRLDTSTHQTLSLPHHESLVTLFTKFHLPITAQPLHKANFNRHLIKQ